jgi:hypothetical protein
LSTNPLLFSLIIWINSKLLDRAFWSCMVWSLLTLLSNPPLFSLCSQAPPLVPQIS